MLVLVLDPLNYAHHIWFTKNGVFGQENIGHMLALKEARSTLIRELLIRIFTTPETGLYEGYKWVQVLETEAKA